MAVQPFYRSISYFERCAPGMLSRVIHKRSISASSSALYLGIRTCAPKRPGFASPIFTSLKQRCFYSADAKVSQSSLDLDSYQNANFTRFFRMPAIVHVRLLSKIKLYQTGITFICVPFMTVMCRMDLATISSVYLTVAINLLACAMLYVVTGITRRMIGTISVSDDHQVACIAHLNFWGNRVETCVPVEQIMPLSDSPGNLGDIYFKVLLYDTDKFFNMSLKYGVVEDKKLFQKVMGIVDI